MSEPDPVAAFDIAALAADPEASHWARACGWVPGTGYCRNRGCSQSCLFRAQRAAEARRVTRERQQRRTLRRRLAARMRRFISALLTEPE